jgi:hypothetical protein
MSNSDVKQDTRSWVLAFCEENKITQETLVNTFLESIADHAGRREGFWESSAIEYFIHGNGWDSIATRFNGIGESI